MWEQRRVRVVLHGAVVRRVVSGITLGGDGLVVRTLGGDAFITMSHSCWMCFACANFSITFQFALSMLVH